MSFKSLDKILELSGTRFTAAGDFSAKHTPCILQEAKLKIKFKSNQFILTSVCISQPASLHIHTGLENHQKFLTF